MRRFLLHFLPRGFVKIRHFGFLANWHRREALTLCHTLLSPSGPQSADPPQPTQERMCPLCKIGILRFIETISAALLATRTFPGSPLRQLMSKSSPTALPKSRCVQHDTLVARI